MMRLRAAAIVPVIAGLAAAASIHPAATQQPAADRCGYYHIVGCFGDRPSAEALLDEAGGPVAGGGAGTSVVNTNELPNFRDGFYCVADGPYADRRTAARIAWTEFAPDSYVKRGC